MIQVSSQVWLSLSDGVVCMCVQLLAAKLGVVTGQHLAQVCRKEYALLPRLGLWIAMELAIIGADIQVEGWGSQLDTLVMFLPCRK